MERLLLLVLLSWIPEEATSLNAGFRIEITEKGLDYIRQVAVPMLVKELQNVAIPDQSGSADAPVIGGIDYSLTNIKGSAFSIPSSSLTSVAGKGIEVTASGATIHLTADWHYREHSWPHISDSGSCDVSASSISLSVVVSIGESSGHPTLSTVSCSFNIGHLDVDFHGGASWLYNLFSGTIADALKGSIQGSVCNEAISEINTAGNKALATLPVTEQLTSYSAINFELIQAPIYTSSYLQTFHKGEFVYLPRANQTIPFEPGPFPPPASSSNSMMTLWLSEYVANTAGYVFQEGGFLEINITQSTLPSGFPLGLNTSSFKLLIPQLYEKYPNKAMQVLLNATSAPFLNTTASFINMTGPGQLVAYVIVDNETIVNAFTLGLVMHATVHVSLKQNGTQEFVIGNATYLRSDMTLVHSNIGDFPVEGLQATVNLVFTLGVIPLLNKYGAAGFPIPVVDGVTFVNPSVAQGQGYIQISTDIQYNPSLLFDEKYVTLDDDKARQDLFTV